MFILRKGRTGDITESEASRKFRPKRVVVLRPHPVDKDVSPSIAQQVHGVARVESGLSESHPDLFSPPSMLSGSLPQHQRSPDFSREGHSCVAFHKICIHTNPPSHRVLLSACPDTSLIASASVYPVEEPP